MSAKKKSRPHRVEAFCCLADGLAAIVNLEFAAKLTDEEMLKYISDSRWLKTDSGFIRTEHITSVKQIKWSEGNE